MSLQFTHIINRFVMNPAGLLLIKCLEIETDNFPYFEKSTLEFEIGIFFYSSQNIFPS